MKSAQGGELTLPHVLRFACPVVAAICLVGGLAYPRQEGDASVVAVTSLALLSALAMVFTYRWPFAGLATTALVGFTGLAAYGLLAHADSLLMLTGAAAALAGWDLALEEIRRSRDANPDGALAGALERSHLRSLALAIGAGLLAAVIGQNLQVRLPFIVVALLVGLGVWMLERVLWEVNR